MSYEPHLKAAEEKNEKEPIGGTIHRTSKISSLKPKGWPMHLVIKTKVSHPGKVLIILEILPIVRQPNIPTDSCSRHEMLNQDHRDSC